MQGNVAGQSEDFTFLHRDPKTILGRCGNALFAVSGGASTVEGLDRSHRFTLEMLEESPEGIAKVVLTAAGATMPSPEVRKRIKELSRDPREKLLCMSMVIGTTTAWSGMMRMVANTMMSTMPSAYPRAMFGNEEQAASWTYMHCGESAHFEPGLLAEALRQARPLVEAS